MTSLDHIGLYVKDLSKSLDFYKDLFGFPVVNEFGSGEAKIAVMDIGGGLLELVQRPGSPGTPPGGNWSHLALHVPDFDDKLAKLEGMGLELRKVTASNGSRLCFFKDPDGHTLELMEKGFA
ncbi:MAG: VOC family protein [Candidatus Bathyarchaeota archaeon]|nr:VOC family protein [Candidatus Bathyarchaeota archaeon]